MKTKTEFLAIARWQRIPRGFPEDIFDGEIVEGYTQCTGQADATAPSRTEFKLDRGFLFNGLVDVNRTIVLVGNGLHAELLLIKITKVDNFTL